MATLRALLDRLIPSDEFPGAVQAGVENYLARQLAGDSATEAQLLAGGLRQLDVEAAARHSGNPFGVLSAAEQDALLREIERGTVVTAWPTDISSAAFFTRVVELAHEGFYADPANGGNLDASSWRMIGYDPRTPPASPQTRATSLPV